MIDVTEILVHWHAGRSQADIATSLGVDRKTVRKYSAPAIAAGLVPGGAALGEAEWVELVRGWFPELVDTRLRQSSWPAIEVFHDTIKGLLPEVTVSTIHQRLRDEHGLEASLSSLRRYLAANLPEEMLAAQVTVLRDGPAPGHEAQVDYGMLGMWWDPARQARRRVWAFVMVLAASRHMFVRPLLVMDQRAWNDAHVAAFAFFGGVTERIVPDNLKTGVERPDLYDPKINRSYAELGAHYGLLIDPARIFKPKDKARVERPMPYVRDSYFMPHQGKQWAPVAAGKGTTDAPRHRNRRATYNRPHGIRHLMAGYDLSTDKRTGTSPSTKAGPSSWSSAATCARCTRPRSGSRSRSTTSAHTARPRPTPGSGTGPPRTSWLSGSPRSFRFMMTSQDKTALVCENDGLGPVSGASLHHHSRDVRLDGRLAQHKSPSYLTVRQAPGHKDEYLTFTRGESFNQGHSGRWASIWDAGQGRDDLTGNRWVKPGLAHGNLAYSGRQVLWSCVFQDKAACPGAQGSVDRFIIAERCQDEHLGEVVCVWIAVVRTEQTGSGDPVHPRHTKVHHNDRGMKQVREAYSFGSVAGFTDHADIWLGGQQHCDASANERLIIGDDRRNDHCVFLLPAPDGNGVDAPHECSGRCAWTRKPSSRGCAWICPPISRARSCRPFSP